VGGRRALVHACHVWDVHVRRAARHAQRHLRALAAPRTRRLRDDRPTGSCESTVTTVTVKPAGRSSLRAAEGLLPTTSGTSTRTGCGRAFATSSRTSLPCAADASSLGDCSMTVPAACDDVTRVYAAADPRRTPSVASSSPEPMSGGERPSRRRRRRRGRWRLSSRHRRLGGDRWEGLGLIRRSVRQRTLLRGLHHVEVRDWSLLVRLRGLVREIDDLRVRCRRDAISLGRHGESMPVRPHRKTRPSRAEAILPASGGCSSVG
jgi:hypothetical protein